MDKAIARRSHALAVSTLPCKAKNAAQKLGTPTTETKAMTPEEAIQFTMDEQGDLKEELANVESNQAIMDSNMKKMMQMIEIVKQQMQQQQQQQQQPQAPAPPPEQRRSTFRVNRL